MRGDSGTSDDISIHAPPRGATRASARQAACTLFQFTPLREGRRAMRGDSGTSDDISIHAPPRGATDRRFCRRPGLLVHFNSRPSARGDGSMGNWCKPIYISIHAPPRGATKENLLTMALEIISIHAPPRGATAKDMQFLQIFCSTLTNQHGLTIVPRNLSRLFW